MSSPEYVRGTGLAGSNDNRESFADDDTFIAAGERRSAPSGEADLLSCSASGTCKVVAPAFSTFTFSKTPPRTAPFALPTGSAIYDLYS